MTGGCTQDCIPFRWNAATESMVGSHTVMRLEPLPTERCAGP
jgi:hypothetical protein